jgi:tRNA threonylcarbamoyladenosine biosynthesis protein TsaB
MLVLALETCGEVCGVALGDGETVLASRDVDMLRGHAEALAPLVREVLAEAGIAPAAVGMIALTIGPGSFTGVRIATAFARAWALAAGIGVVAVTSTEALAEGAAAAPRIAVIDARRGQVYEQRFATDRTPLGPPAVVPRTAEHGVTGSGVAPGSGAWLVTTSGGIVPVRPAAALVLRAAARALRRGDRLLPGGAVAPLYLRPADADPGAGRALVRPA